MDKLDYKLVKELWEAGFPFKENDSKMVFTCLCTKETCEIMGKRFHRFDGELYEEPTLDELIDAVGMVFSVLINIPAVGKQKHEWEVLAKNNDGAVGDTRKEAVAKLFIKLNGNPPR